ncbi:hypothetical protein A8O14_00705 [Polynucleobacter wuianus]|uniref:Glycosyltransferase 2-like domain-containing protein n=1 Tax=Polynucleobacter wuianus TaxID=1743168 RepID=A0A191UCQ8_9BURK|nr:MULTISPECIES: hypothetical protein [Polynucleobacter]ANI98747.1 hypothetical protein A8O14_00705 [Polynucleobacter wuianus]MBU3553310.1 hypothetical protein [Polynucleobacter sp. MWH-Post4-6-1]
MQNNNGNKLLITGLVRNLASSLSEEIRQVGTAFGEFDEVSWLLIESDSIDDTIGTLNRLQNKIRNFKFLSLGNLENIIPKRTARLAYLRNIYLDELRNKPEYLGINYVAVIDFDRNNSQLTPQGVRSCFDKSNWAVCTANQSGPYYDIWALRHFEWCPADCWRQFYFLVNHGLHENPAKFSAIYSKMIFIEPKSDWLEVQSSFGGLAVYLRSYLNHGQYVGLDGNGNEICEHVSLHKSITENGGKIFINPALINTDFTDHSEPLKAAFLASKS